MSMTRRTFEPAGIPWYDAIIKAYNEGGRSIKAEADAIHIDATTLHRLFNGQTMAFRERAKDLLEAFYGVEVPEKRSNRGRALTMEHAGFGCRVGSKRYQHHDSHPCLDEVSLAVSRYGLSDPWIELEEKRLRWWRKRTGQAVRAVWNDDTGAVDCAVQGWIEVGERGIKWIATTNKP